MTDFVDRARYLLSEADNERIFRGNIVPTELDGTSQERPIVVAVAGQTGAGKTAVTSLLEQTLSRRGRLIKLDLDKYKPHHPQYQDLAANDPRTVGAYTSIDGHKWMEKAEAYAIEQRFDVVLESAMRDPRDFEEPVRRFQAAGYQVHVVVVAVHESLSRLGALERYLQQAHDLGQGRHIDPAIHDACYQGVLRSADAIDNERLAGEVFVGRRDAHIVYANGLDDGSWRHPAGTRAAIEQERNRPWSAEEAQRYLGSLKRVQQLCRQLPADLRAVAGPELTAITRLADPLIADGTIREQAAAIARELNTTPSGLVLPTSGRPEPPLTRTTDTDAQAGRRMLPPARGTEQER